MEIILTAGIPRVCKKKTEGLQPVITLLDCDPTFISRFREALKKIFSFVDGQNIITDITTSPNENLHSKLQIWLSKNIDLWASFKIRARLFVIHHNCGLFRALSALSEAAGFPFDEIDQSNITTLLSAKEKKVLYNRQTLDKKKEQQKRNVETARENLAPANVEKAWLLYGSYPQPYIPIHLETSTIAANPELLMLNDINAGDEDINSILDSIGNTGYGSNRKIISGNFKLCTSCHSFYVDEPKIQCHVCHFRSVILKENGNTFTDSDLQLCLKDVSQL